MARTVALVAAVGALAWGAGCNIVGPAFLLVHGPEKTPARFTLEEDRTTIVFLDDRANHIPRRSMRSNIAENVGQMLLDQDCVKDLVSAGSAMLAASQETADKPTPIAEIGRAVGAEVVVYATVDDFSLSPDGQTYEPYAIVRVKVVDVTADKRLWPPDEPNGFRLLSRVLPKQGAPPTAVAERLKAETELADQLSLDIARLFFKHESPKGVKVPD